MTKHDISGAVADGGRVVSLQKGGALPLPTADVDGDMAYAELKMHLEDTLGSRNYFVREVQEAEALLARVTARVSKRKATLAEIEARLLDLRTQAHMLGVDGSLGKDLMGL